MVMSKTIYFEEKYGVNINQFKSIEEIDSFVEGKIGRPLTVVSTASNVIDRTGNVLTVKKYDIEKMLEKALNS
jgi:hypothetical protein